MKVEDYEGAIREFKDAVELDRANKEYWVNIAIALQNIGRVDEAIESMDSALKLDPEDHELFAKKAGLLYNSGRYEEAIVSLVKALKIKRDVWKYWESLGMIYSTLERWRDAVKAYAKASRLNSKSAEIWKNYGMALLEIQEFSRASEALERSLELNRDDVEAWKMRGMALERLGEKREALKCYDYVLGLNPADKDVWKLKGDLQLDLGNYDNAIRSYKKALEIDPDFEEARAKLEKAKEMKHMAEIDEYARRVLRFEYEHRRVPDREDIFKYCNVPLNSIDEVIAYIERVEPISISSLSKGERERYERYSRELVLRALESNHRGLEKTGIKLSDVVALYPDMRISDAKKIVQYIDHVMISRIYVDKVDPSLEALVKEATEIPDHERDIYHIMKRLNIGIYRAMEVMAAMEKISGGGYRELEIKPAESGKKEGKEAVQSRERKYIRKDEIDLSDEHCVFCGKLTEYMHDCGLSMCPECEATHDYCPYCGKPLHPEKTGKNMEKDRKEDALVEKLLVEGKGRKGSEEDDFRL